MLADMRTGSNFLEENLNQFADLRCHGELFNPLFVGNLGRDEKFGITINERDRNPAALLEAMIADDPAVLPGFRLFSDHDPRMIEHCLADRAAAKIVLQRNPLESFISNRIAAATDQWRMTNVRTRRKAEIAFDADHFAAYLNERLAYQRRITRALQVSGQTAFYIHYDDLHDVEVINGLAAYLGSGERIDRIFNRLKKQNPGSLLSKVTNPEEMQAAIARMDLLSLARIPNYEPRRGPAVPSYIAGTAAPLLFVPVRGGPIVPVRRWIAAHEAALGGPGLAEPFNQKTLRHWKRNAGPFAAFALIRHPVARAYAVFTRRVLSPPGKSRDLKRILARVFEVELPDEPAQMDAPARAAAFKGFLRFIAANLQGQTALGVDAAWASQSAIIEGVTRHSPLHRLIREPEAETGLAEIEAELGLAPQPFEAEEQPGLAEIYDDEVEALAHDAYMRDYLAFGFGRWG
ncbi:MAG: nodulation protein NodH [Alphaproteobacteria bacterium]|nr:MAG: nodulation protein NodH [Alphaproteobacteria bacterium]